MQSQTFLEIKYGLILNIHLKYVYVLKWQRVDLWWLFCVILTGLMDAQIVGETLCLGMSVKVFLEQISIWFSRLIEEIFPY